MNANRVMDLAVAWLSVANVGEEILQSGPGGMALAPRQFSRSFVVSEQRLELGDELIASQQDTTPQLGPDVNVAPALTNWR